MPKVIVLTALEIHRATWASIAEGGLTIDEIKQAHDVDSASIDELRTAVSKSMTVKELKRNVHGFSDDKKAALVARYVDKLLDRYPFMVKNIYNTFSSGFDEMQRMTAAEYQTFVRDEKYKSRCQVLEELTDEHLAQYIDDRAKQYAAQKARVEQLIAAQSDPQTVDDWNAYINRAIKLQKIEGVTVLDAERVLTVDELTRYDAAIFAQYEGFIKRQLELSAKVAQIDTDADMTISKEWHTKKDCEIWVVRLSVRVDRDDFKALQAAAHRMRGRWPRWGEPGFVFYSEAAANTFAGVKDGTQDVAAIDIAARERREERAADRLEQYAIRKNGTALDSLTIERLANTARRARIANGMESDARFEQAFAATIQSLATAMFDKELHALIGVRYGTDIAELITVMRQAHFAAQRAEGMKSIDPDRPMHIDDVQFSKVPYPNLTGTQLASLYRNTHGRRGLGNSRKIVEAMLKERTYSDDPLSLSDVVATRTARQANAIVAMIEKLGLQKDDEFEWRIASYKRFQRMQLTTGPLLRHAAREFFTHYSTPKQPDELTVALRELVGRKIEGYYPTPSHVADKMVEMVSPRQGEIGVETSAGTGNLIDAILRFDSEAQVAYFEPVGALFDILATKYVDNQNVAYAGSDGLQCSLSADYAIINPPFENGQDLRHVRATFDALKEGGRMAAIVAAGAQLREDSLFMSWLNEANGYVEEFLPAGTFYEAGTNVRTALIYIEK